MCKVRKIRPLLRVKGLFNSLKMPFWSAFYKVFNIFHSVFRGFLAAKRNIHTVKQTACQVFFFWICAKISIFFRAAQTV